jgi:hypothetical protein
MVYGAEAVLPTDIAFRSPRVENFDNDRSNESRELEVNYSEERRLDSYVRTAKYLAILRKYYNKNVKERFFMVGDLVLKWKMSQDGMHKLFITVGGTIRGHRSYTAYFLQAGLSRWH